MSRLIVWGCGELGGRVGLNWMKNGGRCLAVTKTTTRHAHLRSLGFSVDVVGPTEFEEDDRLLICVPGTARLQSVVQSVRHHAVPNRVVLTSSTGFYHGLGGRIDHSTQPGSTPRAQEIAQMEEGFRQWAGNRGVIIRFGGLYRPGRGPLNAFRERGAAPPGPADKTLALIHYEDAATACLAALMHSKPKPHYIGVTPPCPSRRDFYMAASVILGLNLPSFGRNSGTAPADYGVNEFRNDLLPSPGYPRWQAALIPDEADAK